MSRMKFMTVVLAVLLAGSIYAAPVAGKAASSRPKGPQLAWQGGMAVVGPTGSFKYQVRAVPDGAGGVILAWEENRYRKACCRDLRDVYLQRYDQTGSPLWGASDYQAAGEEIGEELVGMLPGKTGGAMMLWRREGGMLFSQEVASSGAPRLEPLGRVLWPCRQGCEWNPIEAFCVDPAGNQALASWIELGSPSVAKSIRISREGDGFTYSTGMNAMEGAGLRAASPVSLGGKGWLVTAWHTRGAGSRMAGQFLDAEGKADGQQFTVTMNEGCRWMNMQCTSSGNAALILWSAINPDEMPKTHDLYLTRVERRGDGKPSVTALLLGKARTSGMYIPPVRVEMETTFTWTGQTQFENVGKENLFWRRTSSLFVDDSGGALVWWVEGEKIRVTRVECGQAGLKAGKGFTIGSSPDIGFTPFVIPLVKGRLLLVWAERRAKVYRVLGRQISASGGEPAAVGDTIVFQEDSSDVPRWSAMAEAGDRSAWLLLSSLTGKGTAVSLRLGRVSW